MADDQRELGLELLDAGAAVFAADHQVAHLYVNDPAILNDVKAPSRRLMESILVRR